MQTQPQLPRRQCRESRIRAIYKYPPSEACTYTQELHNQSNRSTCMFKSISYCTSAWIADTISHRSHLQFKPHPSSNLSPPLTAPPNATPSTPPKVSKSFQTHRICRPSGSRGATFIYSKPQLKLIAFHENLRSCPVSASPSHCMSSHPSEQQQKVQNDSRSNLTQMKSYLPITQKRLHIASHPAWRHKLKISSYSGIKTVMHVTLECYIYPLLTNRDKFTTTVA